MTNEQIWYMLKTQLDSFNTILQEVTKDLLIKYPEIETIEYSSILSPIPREKSQDIKEFKKLYAFLSNEEENLNNLLGDNK